MSQEKSHTVNATGRKAAHTGHMTKRHLPQGHVYSRVPNKRTPPLIRNFQKNPKNWPNFGEKNQFSKKQKGSHENRMLEINELIILQIFHTFLYPR